jgi:hypothetical protein
MRISVIALPVLLSLTLSADMANVVDPKAAWIKECEVAISVKESGMVSLATYRDDACFALKGVAQNVCTVVYNALIDELGAEKGMLQAMIAAVKLLPSNQRDAMRAIMIPAFNRANAATAALTNHVRFVYPQAKR